MKKEMVFGKVMQEKEIEIEIDKEIKYRHHETPKMKKQDKCFGMVFK